MDENIFFLNNPWRNGTYRLPDGIIERDMFSHACTCLDEPEILLITGLRQTGKSTLARQLIYHLLTVRQVSPATIFYLTFDDLSLRHELAASFPSFIKIIEKLLGGDAASFGRLWLFVDEVQKLPGFVEYVKSLHDSGYPIKWVLTGSSAIELMSQVRESLAGRVLHLPVYPFSECEVFRVREMAAPDKKMVRAMLTCAQPLTEGELRRQQAALLPFRQDIERISDDILLYGSLPAVARAGDGERRLTLLKNYRDTYLEQDIRGIVKDDKLWVYQRVMEILAGRTGDLLNYTDIAGQTGVAVDTIKRYVSLLEKTFLIRELTTYSRNIRAEQLKSPRIYFTDLGIRNILLGITELTLLDKLNLLGTSLENLVAERIQADLFLTRSQANLHYWRTKAKEEVDLVVVTPEMLLPIEIKSDRTYQKRHIRGIVKFLTKETETKGVLIGRFDSVDVIRQDGREIFLLPLWMV
jgi:predicted AAA+ superfamily ATPase